jgi:two-component system sensor histidine kinase KdpD
MEARGFSLSLSFVDVSDIANESLDAAKPDLDEGRVMLELPPTGLIARVDASLVSRLAANLLRNAARYSPSGSPIGLVFEAHGRDLAITVRDHGPGVPEAELPAIFDRFSRGHKAKGGGLGLGLSICRGIAAAHGGSIGARNLPGGGFEVKALFPSCIEEVEP